MENPIKRWTLRKESKSYEITTAKALLDRSFMNNAYGKDEMYWIKAMSASNLETLIANSVILGLYATPERNQIGFARLITDTITFAYLTDVYISPDYRGLGLGLWLVQCMKEMCKNFPELRRVLLLVGTGEDEEGLRRLYEGAFGMEMGLGIEGIAPMSWMPDKEKH